METMHYVPAALRNSSKIILIGKFGCEVLSNYNGRKY